MNMTEEEIKALEDGSAETTGSMTSAPKGSESMGSFGSAFADAFQSVEWQPGEDK